MQPALDTSGGIQLGVDVGGTFTDVVACWDGGVARTKVRSTPSDPSEGVLNACRQVAEEMGTTMARLLPRLTRFGLGTTVVTNVLATATGRRLGLITTAGFEEIIPLARGRLIPDGGWLVRPPSLVDRDCIIGVRERCHRDGSVSVPVDPDEILAAGERLVQEAGVESLVVSFLWAFRNHSNEDRASELLRKEFPDTPVISAAGLAPVIREYERTQFALLNAYVGDALDWLAPLAHRLSTEGMTAELVLLHSSGGAISREGAVNVPVGLAQSGPAAGVAAATALAQRTGTPSVVTCDLGGTSLDVAIVHDGQPLRRTRGEIVGHWTTMSMVDIDSVGSGGGSIAWVDSVGALRVGPRSAGAEPGPACYGQGGQEPTLTDALVVLGFIDPGHFSAGHIRLDPEAAFRACESVGTRIGVGPEVAAWGIREVALALMSRAIKRRLASRGLAGAELSLVVFGGCGPLFGAELGADVQARSVIIPQEAAVFSALGAAMTPLRREVMRPVMARLPMEESALQDVCVAASEEAKALLQGDGVPVSAISTEMAIEMRFERQAWEMNIPLDGTRPAEVTPTECADLFRREYARRFGEGALSSGVGIEIVAVRALAREQAEAYQASVSTPRHRHSPDGREDQRSLHLEKTGPRVQVPVLPYRSFSEGTTVDGPALIQAEDTEIWIPHDYVAQMYGDGSLSITAIDGKAGERDR